MISKFKLRLKGVNLNGCVVVNREERWSLPDKGWVKINVDGAVNQMQQGGCGGVIRDDNGDFIAGFFFKINNCFSLLTEIRAMLHGLKLAWDRGFRKVVIESDSLKAAPGFLHTCWMMFYFENWVVCWGAFSPLL